MTTHPAPQPGSRPGDQTQTAAELETEWKTDARWNGIERSYSAEDVIALRGSVREERTLARRGAENLWRLIHGAENGTEPWVPALGALTGNQAVQMVRAGLKAIYLSGWQVAADANLAGADVSRPEPLPGQQRARAGRAASTTRCCAPTRSSSAHLEGPTTTSTGSRPSSPTPKPASAARSTPSRS
jgi:hypothetical protein